MNERNTDLPPELRAMAAAMDMVFGAINAAPERGCSHCAFTQHERAVCGCPLRFPEMGCPFYDAPPAAPIADGSDGVVKRGPVRSTKPGPQPADSYTPSEAVALAIADHRAGKLVDWPFVDALRKAEDRANAYPNLVEALRTNAQQPFAPCDNGERWNEGYMRGFQAALNAVYEQNTALLRELGEAS